MSEIVSSSRRRIKRTFQKNKSKASKTHDVLYSLADSSDDDEHSLAHGVAVRTIIQADSEGDGSLLDDSEQQFLRRLEKRSHEKSAASSVRANDAVTLDVGGQEFRTTKTTLCKYSDTFFAALFGGAFAVPASERGTVFIDRDGTHFRLILNFMRCGAMVWPESARARREVMLEAAFYGLERIIMQQQELEAQARRESVPSHVEWRSNVIFIGEQNLDPQADNAVRGVLADVQCPTTSEMVWKAIHDTGLTVVFQIINTENSDFSLAGMQRILPLLERWRRRNLRFVLVYDAELIRELLKLSGEPFNNSSYIWYFSRGKLISSGVGWKLRYVAETIWKHYYSNRY